MSLDSILTQAANALGASIGAAVSPTTAATTTMPPDLSTNQTLKGILKTKSLLPEYACFVVCNDRKIYVAAALPDQFTLGSSAEYDRPFADTLPNKASMIGGIPKLIGMQPLVQALTARFWSGSSSGSIRLPIVLQAQTNEVNDVLKPFADLMTLMLPSAPNGLGSILRSPGPSFSVTKAVQAGNSLVRKVAQGASDAASSFSLPSLSSLTSVKDTVSSLIGGLNDNKTVAQITSGISSIESASTSAFNTLDSAIKNKISIQIGRYMIFDNVVIRNVSSTHKVQPVGGLYGSSTGNMQRIDVELEFEPFFDLTIQSLQSIFLDQTLRDYMTSQLKNASGV